MKILLTGHTGYNTIAPFYRRLGEANEQFELAVYGLNRGDRPLTAEERATFSVLIDPPKIDPVVVAKGVRRLKWWPLLGVKGWKEIIKRCGLLRFRGAYQFLYDLVYKKQRDDYMRAQFSVFDIINIHYLSPQFLSQLAYVQPHQKIMLSFWGSDLFQEAGVVTYATQLAALNRADAITLQTVEMKQILLSKFGRHLSDKVHCVQFGCDSNRFDYMDSIEEQAIIDFKSKYKIPNDKMIVQIGYSGGPGHHHLQVLDALECHADALKDQVFLVLPTTYGNSNKDYFERLRQRFAQSPFDGIQLVEYLSDAEVLVLPLVCDVLINVRDADALNASMMEAMYANNLLIVGSWLPYGSLRRAELEYEEVECIEEVGTILKDYCQQPKDIARFKGNPRRIRTHFIAPAYIPVWASIYEGLYSSKATKS